MRAKAPPDLFLHLQFRDRLQQRILLDYLEVKLLDSTARGERAEHQHESSRPLPPRKNEQQEYPYKLGERFFAFDVLIQYVWVAKPADHQDRHAKRQERQRAQNGALAEGVGGGVLVCNLRKRFLMEDYQADYDPGSSRRRKPYKAHVRRLVFLVFDVEPSQSYGRAAYIR